MSKRQLAILIKGDMGWCKYRVVHFFPRDIQATCLFFQMVFRTNGLKGPLTCRDLCAQRPVDHWATTPLHNACIRLYACGRGVWLNRPG